VPVLLVVTETAVVAPVLLRRFVNVHQPTSFQFVCGSTPASFVAIFLPYVPPWKESQSERAEGSAVAAPVQTFGTADVGSAPHLSSPSPGRRI
jgi:hypothetical protein